MALVSDHRAPDRREIGRRSSADRVLVEEGHGEFEGESMDTGRRHSMTDRESGRSTQGLETPSLRTHDHAQSGDGTNQHQQQEAECKKTPSFEFIHGQISYSRSTSNGPAQILNILSLNLQLHLGTTLVSMSGCVGI